MYRECETINQVKHKKRYLLKAYIYLCIALLSGICRIHAQHHSAMQITVDPDTKILKIQQEITYHNTTNDTLKDYILNDWNNAYSDKSSPLGKRFSDEFTRIFHLAGDSDRGHTDIISIIDQNQRRLEWSRLPNQPDLVDVHLQNPLYPNQKFKINIVYSVKIPNDRFTRYGFDSQGGFYIKNWFLTPARYEKGCFVKDSNENLDDISNAVSDFDIQIKIPSQLTLTTDLDVLATNDADPYKIYTLSGKNRQDILLAVETTATYSFYKNDKTEIATNINEKKLDDFQKAVIIDRVVNYVSEHLGSPAQNKMIISQTDYDRNPFYGLNQLPKFLRPFPDSFVYELKFLKTYVNNYLKNTLQLNHREDNWIYDGIQVYTMMKYIEDNYPNVKMTGTLARYKILRGFSLFSTGFNEQYSYLYLMMARMNLDQPIGNPKNTFVKFNEQISGKYKAGLALNYLDAYLQQESVDQALHDFVSLNKTQQTTRLDIENILKSKTDKNIDWFFKSVINSRDLIDYKFGRIKESDDGKTVQVTVKNNAYATVPISLYGVKKDRIISKVWLPNVATDTVVTVSKEGIDRLALNYGNEVPEFNRRNNYKTLKGFPSLNRPIKFNFFKDLEDPQYNQLFYVPDFNYNLYDGVMLGMRIHNETLLDKPFQFDITPDYSSNTKELVGSATLSYFHNIRDERLYNIRYSITGSTLHYAPNASYTKITPSVQFRFREPDYRENKRETILLRHVFVEKEDSPLLKNKKEENYSVFNARYSVGEAETAKLYSFLTDLQIANNFSKISAEYQYRKLFDDRRQLTVRFFGGTFMYNETGTDFFSFGLDRPSDYLFGYNLIGRSESTGLFSQQFVMADGGFKSKLKNRYANQWMTTSNVSVSIWNWIEAYGDAGIIKNKFSDPQFVYDSGIRLNLVQDYFELYFPVYSNNGWEIKDPNYGQRIRFVVTLSARTLVSLFTRKWF